MACWHLKMQSVHSCSSDSALDQAAWKHFFSLLICYRPHRVSLQKHLSASTGEGILCDEAGRLLEGFITSLFIVTGDSHMAGSLNIPLSVMQRCASSR